MDHVVNQDAKLKKEVEIVSSIPGIGELTAVIILAEISGFELIRNKKQLTSYAGFDVKKSNLALRSKASHGYRKKEIEALGKRCIYHQ